MSREIKYKAWDKTLLKMILVTDLNLKSGYLIGEIDTKLVSCKFKDCELLQYTGLKDNNSVEIYEGDIVKGRTTDHEEDVFYMYINGEVGFDNGSFNFKNPLMTYYRWTNYELEVIGNIYENPELLEATK